MFSHRSGLKQSNKRFKGKSKGKVKQANKGKVEGPRPSAKHRDLDAARANRHNRIAQIQKQKRSSVIAGKRLGLMSNSPRIVALVSLSAGVNLGTIREGILKLALKRFKSTNPNIHTFTTDHHRKGQRFTLYECPRDVIAVLDICKIADVVLFVTRPESEEDPGVDEMGYELTKMIKGQGVPTLIGLTQGITHMPPKKQPLLKRLATRYFHTTFEDTPKVLNADSPDEFSQVVRWLSNTKTHGLSVRDGRSYMLAEHLTFSPNENQKTGTLSMTGFLRGDHSLSANQLVHVTGYGDFQLRRLDQVEPEPRDKKGVDVTPSIRLTVMEEASPDKQESLEETREVDPLAQEQSIITDAEMAAADQARNEASEAPDGMSEYQKVWDDLVSDDEEDVGMDAEIDKAEEEDQGPLAGLQTKTQEGPMDLETKRKLEADEMEWPDEVDTPFHQKAKTRFARYRGLKSFRNSPWDVKEQLPLEYSKIFQFEDFAATRKLVTSATVNAGPAQPNSRLRVCVHVANVPLEQAKRLCSSNRPALLWPLFKHEHKVSVIHMQVRRHVEHTDPIKGKEEMVIQNGFRRFVGRPVYSQNNPGCTRHAVERFYQQGRFSAASVYGRLCFSNAPVLFFRPASYSPPPTAASLAASSSSSSTSSSSSPSSDMVVSDDPVELLDPNELGDLVATGGMLAVDPDRLLIKRVILTGNPISVHKRTAVVRFLFYNPDDVRWFKPVELWTKYGIIGHIRESRGTKGLMKCTFDGYVKNHDTVCLSLYKRQFPKWPPNFY